jgi:hypothetical protein
VKGAECSELCPGRLPSADDATLLPVRVDIRESARSRSSDMLSFCMCIHTAVKSGARHLETIMPAWPPNESVTMLCAGAVLHFLIPSRRASPAGVDSH